MRLVKTFAALAALTAAGSAAQAVTIVQYFQTGNKPSVQLVNSGQSYTLSTIGASPAGAPVVVNLFDPISNASAFFNGRFTFTASGNEDAVLTGTGSNQRATQNFSGGSFSLVLDGTQNFGGRSGTNVLTASFTGGSLSGLLSGLTSAFQVSIPVDSFTSYSSDFFSNPPYQLTNFALSMSDANRGIRIGSNGSIRDFTASSTGTFGAAVVPEPATWALLIAGFGMVGVALRRRERITRVAA